MGSGVYFMLKHVEEYLLDRDSFIRCYEFNHSGQIHLWVVVEDCVSDEAEEIYNYLIDNLSLDYDVKVYDSVVLPNIDRQVYFMSSNAKCLHSPKNLYFTLGDVDFGGKDFSYDRCSSDGISHDGDFSSKECSY